MGTAAVFAVASPNTGKHYTTILGCTMDGFREKKIAKAYREAQRRARLTTEQREAEDRKAKEKKERARQKALQKLTPEDRVALGL